MASSSIRWGLTLLTALFALAFAIRLQTQPQQPLGAVSAPVTHCYSSVRTHNPSSPSAQCFTIQDGIFTTVASREEIEGEVLEHEGHVIPGLWDGHGHLLQYGEFLHSVDLFGAETLDDVRERVKKYVDENAGAGTKDNWVRGVGWDQTPFGRMPTADDIAADPALKDMYIMLDRIDVHCTWVSRPVLALLPPSLPDSVPGGEIVRDPGMGVFCDNAMDIVTRLWPRPSDEQKAAQVRTAMRKLNEVGLVGMHDAGATPGNVMLYSDLADSEDWTVRVYGMLECDKRNHYCPEDAVQVTRDDAKFTVRSVKLFADGALGSWGSAMIDPYTDRPDTSGSLLINATNLVDVSKKWAGDGYQVNIHAIGDLANRHAVDALEAALRQQCPEAKTKEELHECQTRHRFRIEHSQIIHPDDQSRILAMGILPSIQPTHATSDFKYALDRLGKQRLESSAYRMRSLLPARPVLGSDFPVEPPNPFEGMYAAMTRKSPHTGLGPGEGDEGFLPGETLSLEEAMLGFTAGPAYGSFMDQRAGSIQEGAFADWVVLDKNIGEVSVEDIRSLKVKETWVGGLKVHARPT